MAGVHVPTPLSHLLQDPLGCNGAAEGFIFLSACLAGRVYGKTFRQSGWDALSRRIWQRVRLIYFVHLGVLIPATLIIWSLASKAPPLANHFSDFLVHPIGSLALMPLLMHQPPLFDILPLYIIFLGATPGLLKYAQRRGWTILLVISALGWLTAQSGPDTPLENPTSLLPFRWGAFDFLAWQFLWMCGIAIGETSLRGLVTRPPYRIAVGSVGAVIVLAGLYWRWVFQTTNGFNPDVFRWMDKWTLGPLRLLAFGGWTALLIAWNPHPPRSWLAPAALLGRHSLGVFAFHLPLVIAAATIVQMFPLSNAWQTVIGLSVILLLFPWAYLLDYFKRRRAESALKVPVKTVKPPLQATQTMTQ